MATLRGGAAFEAAMKKIAAGLESGGTLRVGFLAGAVYPDGTPIAMVAAINEYGAPKVKIPPRPFFRTMIAKKSPEWPGGIATQLKAKNYDVKAALEVTGQVIAEQLQDSIVNGGWAPNKPSTLARKKGSQPLIDTGRMKDNIRYEVET